MKRLFSVDSRWCWTSLGIIDNWQLCKANQRLIVSYFIHRTARVLKQNQRQLTHMTASSCNSVTACLSTNWTISVFFTSYLDVYVVRHLPHTLSDCSWNNYHIMQNNLHMQKLMQMKLMPTLGTFYFIRSINELGIFCSSLVPHGALYHWTHIYWSLK